MIVRGIDFTSRPRRNKPITCASCALEDETLLVHEICDLASFNQFEDVIGSDGPWIAGLDFPFGQSRKLIQDLGWPETWLGYVETVATMSRNEFRQALEAYKAPRLSGDKEHRRKTDIRAGSVSPQKLYGVPVGLMFYEGAPRLLPVPASILPVRPTSSRAVIVEAYPALVARRWADRKSYKNDTKKKQTALQRDYRLQIVEGLQSSECEAIYGFDVRLEPEIKDRLIDDPSGDQLDAVLCAVQAAWAYTRRDCNYGIPADADPIEGWIVDPGLLETGGQEGLGATRDGEYDRKVFVTKVEAARRQLDAAILFFFREDDDLAIHTVGQAALRIVRDLLSKRGMDVFEEGSKLGFFEIVKAHAEGRLPGAFAAEPAVMKMLASMSVEQFEFFRTADFEDVRAEIINCDAYAHWRTWNKTANFLKHADKDPQDFLDLAEVRNEEILLMACAGYVELNLPLTDAMLIYHLYFSATNYQQRNVSASAQRLISRLRELDEADRKTMCLKLLEEGRRID